MTSTSASDAQREQRRVAITSILAALALVVIKLAAGIVSGSLGLLAEALHSAADLAAAALTLIAIRVAQRPPDARHPWGHGRAEHLAALFEALLLIGATAYIAGEAIHGLLTRVPHVEVRGWLLAVVVFVIAIDIWRVVASHSAARRFNSPALESNALHFASDLAGSTTVLIGLVLVRVGFEQGDSIAALVVASIVAFGAAQLLWENAQVLMDVVPESAERAARRAVAGLELPVTLTRLRIRRSAGAYLADIVISVSAIDHVSQGHALASAVEEAVERALPGSDVVVHVEPDQQGSTVRERVVAAAIAHPGIHEVHNVRVLQVGESLEVSLHLKVRGDMRLDSAHDLADRIERDVRRAVQGMSHVDVHIEPVDSQIDEASEVHDGALADAITEAVRDAVGEVPALRLRATSKGLVAYVSVHAPADQSIVEVHELASRVEAAICAAAPQVDDVVVHTEPHQPTG